MSGLTNNTPDQGRDPQKYLNASDRYDAQGNRVDTVREEASPDADDEAVHAAFWQAVVTKIENKPNDRKNWRRTNLPASEHRHAEALLIAQARERARASFLKVNTRADRPKSERDDQKRTQATDELVKFEREMLGKLAGPGATDVDREILAKWMRERRQQ